MTAPEFLYFDPYDGPGQPGFYHDFLGVRTRLSYVNTVPAHFSGHVFGYPGPQTFSLHSQAEWIGVLRSVLEAKERLVAFELGAGWGPWLVTAAVAARRRGIRDIRLVGVEGSTEHVAFMRQHLVDNDLSPEAHKIIHGVVGQKDGIALFPLLSDASVEWGAEAKFEQETSSQHFYERASQYLPWTKQKSKPMNTVPCISLATLLADFDRVDIIHCDVQGAEADVISAAMSEMATTVRRIVVGTHSRMIEHRLFETFLGSGWRLEMEASCVFQIIDGRPYLLNDGEQVWTNPRLDPG